MTSDKDAQADAGVTTGVSRRSLLAGAAAGFGVGAASVFAAHALNSSARAPKHAEQSLNGDTVIPCHGVHQAGITTEPQSHARLLAFNLHAATDAAALKRLLRVLTDDIEALTTGQGALADNEPQLAASPAGLTVTVGFGAELVRRVNPRRLPEWLAPLPDFSRDALQEEFVGGDLLLQICSDDALTVAHASRMLQKTVRGFASLFWCQDGFRRAYGSEKSGTTMRNLMGQIDGTVNPNVTSDSDMSETVWLDSAASWLSGGTAFVLRRIRMEMDTWDQVDRVGRENVVGRTLANGSPLTGNSEFDEPDFEATNAVGLPIIHAGAHIRRAHSTQSAERILRRSYNYDAGSEQGLLFICFQQDPLRQFVPIQQRLDELDLLNTWVTHIGSAVFALPPGWQKGGMLGETLFA
ncbi:Dyp-type peroxidase [Canibacter zhoujuaniae]|uniref:Dyp-type peroxidase n=1 Tax=Canibacter zhoujuaniae TaxID=2708343 RepID=UPI00142299F6|nr:Dyp-type peroxidase [Canibacter zhoujuaniae]